MGAFSITFKFYFLFLNSRKTKYVFVSSFLKVSNSFNIFNKFFFLIFFLQYSIKLLLSYSKITTTTTTSSSSFFIFKVIFKNNTQHIFKF